MIDSPKTNAFDHALTCVDIKFTERSHWSKTRISHAVFFGVINLDLLYCYCYCTCLFTHMQNRKRT